MGPCLRIAHRGCGRIVVLAMNYPWANSTCKTCERELHPAQNVRYVDQWHPNLGVNCMACYDKQFSQSQHAITVERVVEELKEKRAQRERRQGKWTAFLCGVLAGTIFYFCLFGGR